MSGGGGGRGGGAVALCWEHCSVSQSPDSLFALYYTNELIHHGRSVRYHTIFCTLPARLKSAQMQRLFYISGRLLVFTLPHHSARVSNTPSSRGSIWCMRSWRLEMRAWSGFQLRKPIKIAIFSIFPDLHSKLPHFLETNEYRLE